MSPNNHECYEFGPFQLDAMQRVLTRHGEGISLPPKTMDILLILVRRAGQLIGKDELMRQVWPDAFVEDGNLTTNIFTLRRALGDQRTGAHFIDTVPRHGYRFVAEVKNVELSFNERDGRTPTIAVLPFANDTGNEELRYLAEGLCENIIKNLSLTRLRVMSRSSLGHFDGKELNLHSLAAELPVGSFLLGRITTRSSALVISVELVDAEKGWLKWCESYDCSSKEILEVQDEIIKQVSNRLGLKLSGEEERRITARYTESSNAYHAYLEGRFFWSRFTLNDIKQAITHFKRAIECDPNYALAYSAIIDCYLRLVANYVPVDDELVDSDLTTSSSSRGVTVGSAVEPVTSNERLKLRHEWDWKGAERELRRAQALKSDYPSSHQWHAGYLFVRQLYHDSCSEKGAANATTELLPSQIRSLRLTPNEEVQVFCAIGREQIVIGNFVGARMVLERWLPKSGWPSLHVLDPHTAADLLFTLGNLIGVLALIGRNRGIKRAEAYLSGAIALLEQLGATVLASEARIELARCYYREGLFEESREMLDLALSDLPADHTELRSLCLAVYGCVDRDSGRLLDSLERLAESSAIETGQLVTGFRQLQLATTLKELAISQARTDLYQDAVMHFQQALYEFEAIGNHTNTAATENNFGYLLLAMGKFAESEMHLLRAHRLFNSFSNDLRAAQVNETLAQLYLRTNDLVRAQKHITEAVNALEATDGDAVLAEALNTKGIVACRQLRFNEGRNCFESSYRTAERCGDSDGAVRALVNLYDELHEQLSEEEGWELTVRLRALHNRTNQAVLNNRLEATLNKISKSINPGVDPN